MKTRKEVLSEFKQDADARFQREYPDGRFTVSFTADKDKWATHGRTFFGLFCIKHRDTSWTSWEGKAARQTLRPEEDGVPSVYLPIRTEKYTVPSGRHDTKRHFNSLGDCIAYARKRGFSEELIKAFSDQFINKQGEQKPCA